MKNKKIYKKKSFTKKKHSTKKKISDKKKIFTRKKPYIKKRIPTKKKLSIKKKSPIRKKSSIKKKTSIRKKPFIKKKTSIKKKIFSKKKVVVKEKVRKQKKRLWINKRLELIKKNKKLAFSIDLRKLTKQQREYVKRIRQGYKEGEFRKKLTKYLAVGLIEYYKMYENPDLIRNLNKEIGISVKTLKKILSGKKVSKQTYKKFNNFMESKLNNYENAFLFRIVDILKNNRNKISKKTIKSVVNELYEFLNYDKYEDFSKMSYYDYLSFYS